MDTEKAEVYPGLSSPKVKVTYGKQNINELIKSLIMLDIKENIIHDAETKHKYDGGLK